MTTLTTAQRLAAEGIADSAQDLRQLSAEELRANRATTSFTLVGTSADFTPSVPHVASPNGLFLH
jgi:hypothetical protein